MVAPADEVSDEIENTIDVEFLLLFLFAFEGSLGAVDVFLSDIASLLALVSVPPADVLDGLNRGEFAVADVDVVGDAQEWLVDISDGMQYVLIILEVVIINFPNGGVQLLDLRVKEDDCGKLQSYKGRNILNSFVILVHTHVCQEVHKLQEIVPMRPPVLEILWNWNELLLVQGYLHSLALYLTKRIIWIFVLVFLVCCLETVAVLILRVLEELLQYNFLILFYYSVIALDESRK